MNEVFNQRFLERVRRSRGRAERGEQPGTMEELARKARAAGHTGPLIVGPVRSSLKNSWRDDTKWLEENLPEEFGPPAKAHSPEVPGEVVSTRLRVSLPSVIAPGSSQSALDSAQSLREVPPAPQPVPPLPASWWQSLIYGSPDALLSAADATRAMHLIAQALLVERGPSEFSEGVRVAALRKLLKAHFGAAQAWQAMHGLWRSAPTSPGEPQPNIDQSRWTPGVWDCPRSMPSWRRDFHQEVSDDRRLLEGIGGWCG